MYVRLAHADGLGANTKHEDGLAPLHRAILAGHLDATKAILNADVPPDEPTASGETPLELAKEQVAIKDWLTKELRAKQAATSKEEV